MIAISGVLVLAAIALLVLGLPMALANVWFVYASIVVSLASAACWVVGVLMARRRADTRGGKARSTRSTQSKGRQPSRTSADGKGAKKAAAARGSTAKKEKTGGVATVAPAADSGEVVVIPGRLRYHLSSCRQVHGRDTEELSVDEARHQGYVACSACRPDSVLAARAESKTDESDESGESGESEDAGETQVLVVTGQRRYHLSDCQVVEDAKEDDAVVEETTAAEAKADGLTPCRVCGAPSLNAAK